MTVWVLAAVAAVFIWSWGTGSRAELASLGWYEIFFLFVSSAFLGDCFETVFVWLTRGVLMSRSSLLYAPLSLVWGLGAMLMTLALFPLARKGNLALFTAGAVLGGGFEYLASLVLELATNRLFWDYSNIPLNLDGRTNLWFALARTTPRKPSPAGSKGNPWTEARTDSARLSPCGSTWRTTLRPNRARAMHVGRSSKI